MKRIQLLSNWPFTGDVDNEQEAEDARHIMKVFIDYGYEITFQQAVCMWEVVSANCSKEWLEIPQDEISGNFFIWKALEGEWVTSICAEIQE